jgi:hypothetical protein
MGVLRQRRSRGRAEWYIKLVRAEWPELEGVRHVELLVAPLSLAAPPFAVTGVLLQATRNYLDYVIHAEHRPKLDALFRPGDVVLVLSARPVPPKRQNKRAAPA